MAGRGASDIPHFLYKFWFVWKGRGVKRYSSIFIVQYSINNKEHCRVLCTATVAGGFNFIHSRVSHVTGQLEFGSISTERAALRMPRSSFRVSAPSIVSVLLRKFISLFAKKLTKYHNNIESLYRTAGDQRIFFRHHLESGWARPSKFVTDISSFLY